MTLDEFMDKIALYKGQMTFDKDNNIRHCTNGRCPILVVAEASPTTSNADAGTYGQLLGLNDKDINLIIGAADEANWYTPKEVKLRNHMTDVLGLLD